MITDALLVVMILLIGCGGISVVLVVQTQWATARAVEHVTDIGALACPRVDERAWPAP